MLAYLRLFRISNVFTVVADITAGFLLVHGALAPTGGYFGLLIASCLMYTAGMVLNDVFDLDVDRKERPQRPLPSGAISLSTARILGFGFLIAGFGLAAVSGFIFGPEDVGYRTAIWAGCLGLAIVGYDGGLKRTPLGPLAMGSCRTFNFLMAMSLAGGEEFWSLPPRSWCVALGIGIYVAGITWFARTEARTSNRGQLIFGTVVMALGLSVLGSMSVLDRSFAANLAPDQWWFWPGTLALIGVTILRRCILAIHEPGPQRVQAAVKQSLLSLIVFDACILLFALPGQPYYAVFVLLLLIPTLWLGRWIRST